MDSPPTCPVLTSPRIGEIGDNTNLKLSDISKIIIVLNWALKERGFNKSHLYLYPVPVSKWALMCVSRIDARQWPVSTLSLSLPAPRPRPDHWHWSPLSGPYPPQYTCTASASRHQPQPQQPAQTLSYFPCSLRPLSVCDGNLKSKKMLSPPAVTATAVKSKGFRKKPSKLDSKLNQSLKKQRKKERNNNLRGMMSNI